ncbi:MAG: beta-N-acetylhexosaminidase [Bacteroidota bacterium]
MKTQVLFPVVIILLMLIPPLNIKASIIPEPVLMEKKRGSFRLDGNIELLYPDTSQVMARHASRLAEYLGRLPGMQVSIMSYNAASELPKRGIVLALGSALQKKEGYVLEVSNRRILVQGEDLAGVFYGLQSLRQLLPTQMEDPDMAAALVNVKVDGVYIEDYPLFPYRGMHLDVARHFFSVEFVKKYLDLMALHKMNTFHWHLTEDQGWRIEIKKYPLLTEVGAWRKETLIGHGGRPPFKYDGTPYGGYYTQEQVKEIVEYAAQRHITVIPEIEMPGHATAALASYPQLGCTGGPYEVETRWGIFEDAFCAGNKSTFEFLENVLVEVMELFPSQYIHIGGDECLKNRWKECPKCQERISEEGLADEYELQSYFIRRIEKFLLQHDRNIIGWDEILEGGLAPQATVMSWRGVKGGIEAARMGHDVIMTPTSHCYFDYYQADPATQPLAIGGYLTLRQVYTFNPVPPELSKQEAEHILGGQGNVWTEYMKTSEHVEYMVYPRAVALAEVLWSPRQKQDFDKFSERLESHLKRLDALGVNYYR